MGRWVVVAILVGGALVAVLLSMSETLVGLIAPPTPSGYATAIEFTEAYLNDAANVASGKKLWAKRCAVCHGQAAYPGSAPKLRPTRYQPTFIYDRITNGFRGMPALKAEFSLEERRAIVAYVKSPGFKE